MIEERSSIGVGQMRRPSAAKAEKMVATFLRQLETARSQRQNAEDMAIKALRQFACVVNRSGKIPYLLQVHDPHFFATTVALVAGDAQQILGGPNFVSYKARGATSDEVAQHFTAAASYHIAENDRHRLEVMDTLFQRRIFGNSFGHCDWWEDFRLVGRWKTTQIPNPIPTVDEMGNVFLRQEMTQVKEFVTEMKKVKDSPRYTTLNFFNCYPDAEAKSVREGRWFIYHEQRPLSHVKEMGRNGSWYKSAVREITENPLRYTTSEPNVDRMIQDHGASTPLVGQDEDDPLIDVHEYFTPEGRATIVGKSLVVAFRAGYVTGYYPITHVRNHCLPGSFWGMSDLQIVESQLVALQNMVNAQVTESIMQVFKPLIVADPTIDVDRFDYGPGKILKIASGNANAVQTFPSDPTGIQVSQGLAHECRARIDVAIGSSDTRRGTVPTKSTSATAVNASEANAATRMGPAVIEIEDGLVKQIGTNFAKLIMCCQTEAITTKLNNGPEVVTIYPDMLNGDFELEVEVMAGVAQMNELEQKRMLELGNLAMNFQVSTFNREEFIKVLAESTIPRVANRLIMDQQAAARQAMLQQQMQMLNPGPEGAGPGPGPGGGNASPQGQGGISVGDGAMDMGGTTELSRELGGEMRVD